MAGVAARMEPGARAPLDQTYFKRIEAIEFAVRYDDGIGGGLDEADIVLVGVSRPRRRLSRSTSATSATRPRTSRLWGASSCLRHLFEIDRVKIVGLTIDAERLADIREERVRSMGAPGAAMPTSRSCSRSSRLRRGSTGGSAAR